MKVIFAGVVFLALLFLGCANTQPKNNIAQVTDKCLAGSISITDIKGAKQSDGFMKTQIIGQNKSDSYKKLEYKIVWLDRDGFVIKSILSKWREASADANQPFYITNISPNTKADDFRLYIRQQDKEIVCKH